MLKDAEYIDPSKGGEEPSVWNHQRYLILEKSSDLLEYVATQGPRFSETMFKRPFGWD
jgi:hypothetical protein